MVREWSEIASKWYEMARTWPTFLNSLDYLDPRKWNHLWVQHDNYTWSGWFFTKFHFIQESFGCNWSCQICHCTIFSSWPSFLKGIKHLRRSKSDLSTGEIWFVSAHEIRFAANIPPPKMKYLWIRLQRRVTIWVLRWDALIIGDNHCLFVFPDDELAQFSSLHLPSFHISGIFSQLGEYPTWNCPIFGSF